VNKENGDLFAVSIILNRWKDYFSQLFDVHTVSGARQIEIHTTSSFKIEIAIAELKNYKLPAVY
jgi:hypothetical protein